MAITPDDLRTGDNPDVNDDPQLPSDNNNEPELGSDNNGGDELIFGKYKTMEDAQAAFKNLESERGRLAKELGDSRKTQQDLNNAQAEADKAGKLDELAGMMVDSGFEASEEITLKAEEAGIDVRDVKLAAYDKRDKRNSVLEAVGGKESFESVATWAKDNLSESELAQYNAGVKAGNTFVIEAVKGRYEKAMANTEPDMVTGDSVASSNNGTYNSLAEYMADRRDPMYDKKSPKYNPAFVKKVDDKYNRSYKAGKIG